MRFVFVLLLIGSFLTSEGKTKLARMHYEGGGDWYNDADIIPNLAEFLNENIDTNLDLEQITVKPSAADIFENPFIFVTGHGKIVFSDQEAQNLRDYMQRGGFLLIDDDYGLDKYIRTEIKKIFPEKALTELPANHPIFHCFYNFESGLPKIHKHDDKRPQAFAIFDDTGRMMLLYIYESNISDGWSEAHNDPPDIREKAFQMGANIFYYLMTE